MGDASPCSNICNTQSKPLIYVGSWDDLYVWCEVKAVIGVLLSLVDYSPDLAVFIYM